MKCLKFAWICSGGPHHSPPWRHNFKRFRTIPLLPPLPVDNQLVLEYSAIGIIQLLVSLREYDSNEIDEIHHQWFITINDNYALVLTIFINSKFCLLSLPLKKELKLHLNLKNCWICHSHGLPTLREGPELETPTDGNVKVLVTVTDQRGKCFKRI